MNMKVRWNGLEYTIAYDDIKAVVKHDPFVDYLESGEKREYVEIRFKNGKTLRLEGKGAINRWDHEVDKQIITAGDKFAKGA